MLAARNFFHRLGVVITTSILWLYSQPHQPHILFHPPQGSPLRAAELEQRDRRERDFDKSSRVESRHPLILHYQTPAYNFVSFSTPRSISPPDTHLPISNQLTLGAWRCPPPRSLPISMLVPYRPSLTQDKGTSSFNMGKS